MRTLRRLAPIVAAIAALSQATLAPSLARAEGPAAAATHALPPRPAAAPSAPSSSLRGSPHPAAIAPLPKTAVVRPVAPGVGSSPATHGVATTPAPALPHTLVIAPAPKPAASLTSSLSKAPAEPPHALIDALQARAPRGDLLRAMARDASSDLGFFATMRYGRDAGGAALGKLRAIDPKFESLIADPGTVSRLPEFHAFVEAHPALREGDPWAARQAFSDSLGHRTMYRALTLTPEAFEKVRAEGLRSRVERAPTRAAATDVMLTSLGRQVDGRVVNGGPQSHADPLVSLAESPRIATAVAGTLAASFEAHPRLKGQDWRVYLFRVRVPALDVVAERDDSPILIIPKGKEQAELHLSWTDKRGGAHETAQPFATAKVESFVLYGIDPSEIESATEIPRAQAGTYNITKIGTPTALQAASAARSATQAP